MSVLIMSEREGGRVGVNPIDAERLRTRVREGGKDGDDCTRHLRVIRRPKLRKDMVVLHHAYAG